MPEGDVVPVFRERTCDAAGACTELEDVEPVAAVAREGAIPTHVLDAIGVLEVVQLGVAIVIGRADRQELALAFVWFRSALLHVSLGRADARPSCAASVRSLPPRRRLGRRLRRREPWADSGASPTVAS